jgi:predicted Abi (CAAX) family protease
MPTCAPLMVNATRHGWQVVLIAPLLAFVRALALCLGITWGLLSWGLLGYVRHIVGR